MNSPLFQQLIGQCLTWDAVNLAWTDEGCESTGLINGVLQCQCSSSSFDVTYKLSYTTQEEISTFSAVEVPRVIHPRNYEMMALLAGLDLLYIVCYIVMKFFAQRRERRALKEQSTVDLNSPHVISVLRQMKAFSKEGDCFNNPCMGENQAGGKDEVCLLPRHS